MNESTLSNQTVEVTGGTLTEFAALRAQLAQAEGGRAIMALNHAAAWDEIHAAGIRGVNGKTLTTAIAELRTRAEAAERERDAALLDTLRACAKLLEVFKHYEADWRDEDRQIDVDWIFEQVDAALALARQSLGA